MRSQIESSVGLLCPINIGLFHFVLGMALGNATCGTANTHGGGNGPLVQLISAFDPEIHSS